MSTLPEVRSLTVIPPWSLAIVKGWKSPENRGTNIAGSWRGRMLILSSTGKWDQMGAQFIAEQAGLPMLRREDCRPGRYIGAVDLVDVHRQLCRSCNRPRVPDHDATAPGPTVKHPFMPEGGGCCKPWGELGAWHLVGENAVEFAQPVLAVGHLGLRKVTDPALIELAVAGVAA